MKMSLQQRRVVFRGLPLWIFCTLLASTSIDTVNRRRGLPHELAPVPKIASCVTIGVIVLLIGVPLYREGGEP